MTRKRTLYPPFCKTAEETRELLALSGHAVICIDSEGVTPALFLVPTDLLGAPLG